jgi:hypothetical protein
MRLLNALALLLVAGALGLPLRAADDRSLLNACQAMVDRAAQAKQPVPGSNPPNDSELARCRQIIREWTLRDSRMPVDEHGRALR